MIVSAADLEIKMLKNQHNWNQMYFWLLLIDKRLNRQNHIIWVILPFTSVLLHPENMLITGSIYDLADSAHTLSDSLCSSF